MSQKDNVLANVSSLFFKVGPTECSTSGKVCFKRKKFSNNTSNTVLVVEEKNKNTIDHKCEKTNMQIITLNGNNSRQTQKVKL